MNLFLFGMSAEGAADAERAAEVVEELREPFFAGLEVERWEAASGRACAAWVCHPPERVGGIRYAKAAEKGVALFSGRPAHWGDGTRDGRFASVSWEEGDDRPEVRLDSLGAYPLFRAGDWISNSPEALRRLAGSSLDELTLASLLGGGWSLLGDPVWDGVFRVRWKAPDAATLCGGGFDARRAAQLLVESIRGLADWPGRPNVVPVTAGRDSRLVLAAALRAGIEFETVTGGAPDDPDVVVGRRLAEAAGVPHSLLPPMAGGDRNGDWRRAAQVLAQLTGGTATLADAAGFPLEPHAEEGPLPLWHTGQGGEIARGYYGELDEDGLYRRFVGRRPGRAELLSEEGEQLVRVQIDTWAAEQREAGARDEDLADLFYLHQRMAHWAGPTHAAVEPVRDSTSPLWSVKLLPDLLGLPAAERARERFHEQVLAELSPELAAIPYGGGAKGGMRGLARKVAGELRRRQAAVKARAAAGDEPSRGGSTGAGSSGGAAADPFDRVIAEVREAALTSPAHPAWPVLSRPRVEALLAMPAAGMDDMSRQYVWRLATVFGAF